jgi:hypothetical protein
VYEGLTPEVNEIVKKAVEAYPKAWTSRSSTQVCAFSMFSKKTGASKGDHRVGAVCHNAFSYGARNDLIVVNAHLPEWNNKDFLLWATQESPFAHGVLNRNDADELINHAAVLDADVIGNGGALWVCKAVRHFMEDTWVPDTWSKLREYGLDGLQAFIGADILNKDGGPKGGTHVGLFSYGPPKKLRANYDEIRNLKSISGGNAYRNGGYNIYGDSGVKIWGSLKGKKVKMDDGWGGFIEKYAQCEPKEYAEQLKEIFEGDPSNVG